MSSDPRTTTAIVPLRTGGKTRLAPALDEQERATLAGAMLADVAAALQRAGVGRIIVAAQGRSAAAAAGALDLEAVRDATGQDGDDEPGGSHGAGPDGDEAGGGEPGGDEPGRGGRIGASARGRRGERGLDRALREAATRVADAHTLLVVAADLPRLRAAEVEHLLDHDAPVVIAPTVDGGTGGLARRPPTVVPTAYGAGSAERHHQLARDRGLRVEVVHTPGFAHDVDTLADLEALRAHEAGAATARVLATLGLAGRVAG